MPDFFMRTWNSYKVKWLSDLNAGEIHQQDTLYAFFVEKYPQFLSNRGVSGLYLLFSFSLGSAESENSISESFTLT